MSNRQEEELSPAGLLRNLGAIVLHTVLLYCVPLFHLPVTFLLEPLQMDVCSRLTLRLRDTQREGERAESNKEKKREQKNRKERENEKASQSRESYPRNTSRLR